MKSWQLFLLLITIFFLLVFWPPNFWFLPDLSLLLIFLLALFWIRLDSIPLLLFSLLLLVLFSYLPLSFLALDLIFPLLIFILLRSLGRTNFSFLTLAAFFSFLIRFLAELIFFFKDQVREIVLYLSLLNLLSFIFLLLLVTVVSKLRKTKSPRLKTL